MNNFINTLLDEYRFVYAKAKENNGTLKVRIYNYGLEEVIILHIYSKLGQLFPIRVGKNNSNTRVNVEVLDSSIEYKMLEQNIISVIFWIIYEKLRRFYQYVSKPKFSDIKKVNALTKNQIDNMKFNELSIIIPTKNNPHFINNLSNNNLFYLLENGAEVIIVDNASNDFELPEIYKKLSDNGAIITIFNEKFNYSKMINLGASFCSRPILWTINDDIVINNNADIKSLMAYVIDDPLRIVSPQLLYENGNIQQAGISIGHSGICGHLGRHLSPKAAANLTIFNGTILWPAVTGAAMMFHSLLYDKLGGFDENLAVEYNDVDFCLRAKSFEAECAVINDVKMIHLELATRGDPMTGPNAKTIIKDKNVFLQKWQDLLLTFDTFTANIDRNCEKIVAKFPPF